LGKLPNLLITRSAGAKSLSRKRNTGVHREIDDLDPWKLPDNIRSIVATNYSSSSVSQTFCITNAPTFTSLKPYITSATQTIQAQTAVSVSGNCFTYTLPASSVTTFVGTGTSAAPGTINATDCMVRGDSNDVVFPVLFCFGVLQHLV
jgi:hypothetical protein